MKTLRFLVVLLAAFLSVNLCAQEVTKIPVVKVYKGGKVVSEVADADSVVYEHVTIDPTVDRNVYSDDDCTQLLTEASSKVQPKGSVTVGEVWDDNKAVRITSNITQMKIPFNLYNKSLADTVEDW